MADGSHAHYEYADDGDYLLAVQTCRQHDDTAYAGNIEISIDGRTCCLPPSQRQAAAQALAGDGYEVVEKIAGWERALLERQHDDAEAMRRDLRRILAALDLGDHARPDSPHTVVEVEVLPAIEKLKAAEPDAIEKARADELRAVADELGDRSVFSPTWLRKRADRIDPPEPEPEQVEALRAVLSEVLGDAHGRSNHAAAIELFHNHGVTVGERDG